MKATPSATDLLPDPVRWGTKERKTNKHAFAVRWPVRSYSTADWGWYWKHREWVRALSKSPGNKLEGQKASVLEWIVKSSC